MKQLLLYLYCDGVDEAEVQPVMLLAKNAQQILQSAVRRMKKVKAFTETVDGLGISEVHWLENTEAVCPIAYEGAEALVDVVAEEDHHLEDFLGEDYDGVEDISSFRMIVDERAVRWEFWNNDSQGDACRYSMNWLHQCKIEKLLEELLP